MIDVVVGEPPTFMHPVVWMGKALRVLEAYAPRTERARFAYGLLGAIGLPAVWGVLAKFLECRTAWPIRAFFLKSTFAGRALVGASERVQQAMMEDRLQDARLELRSLVSRPTEELDESLVSAAAIESLAENYVDSWVAPLAAYCLFGLGGAYAYRSVNTADAMWGYHTPAYEWLGKASARLDDVLNWVPARLGALLLVAAGARPRRALELWRRDAALTASPNAGHPMSVAAGQLGARLEKRGHYVLNHEGRPPSPADVVRARQLVMRAMLLAACLSLVVRQLVLR